MSGTIVDTSVWIDFLAGHSVPLLEEALQRGSVVVPPVVVAELVSGAGQRKQREALENLLQELPVHETPVDHWVRVGELRGQMRGKGIVVSIPDAHVAQCALDRDALLLSQDAVFARIARHAPLRLHTSHSQTNF